jgi:hypothetical protein
MVDDLREHDTAADKPKGKKKKKKSGGEEE